MPVGRPAAERRPGRRRVRSRPTGAGISFAPDACSAVREALRIGAEVEKEGGWRRVAADRRDRGAA